MRTTVRAPSGEQITVEHPEGASEADIIAYAQQNYAPEKPATFENVSGGKSTTAPPSGFDDFLTGGRRTWDRYAYGVRNALPKAISEPIDRADAWFKGEPALTDEEVSRRLKAGRDEVAAAGPWATAGEIAGDIAITAPVTMGAGVVAPIVARTVGPTLGRVLPQALQTQGARSVAGVTGAITGGGLLGALSDPEDRERGALWGAGGNLVGGLPRAMRVIRGTTGAAGAAGGAAAGIAQGTGRGAAETAEELASRIERGAAEAAEHRIPVTAAQAARSPELAAKEIGVRAALPEEFAHHARQQNEAIYAAMERATRSAESLDDVVKARDTLTKPLRDDALKAAEQYQPVIGGMVARHLDALKGGATGANPSVGRVVAIVQAELNRPGGTNAARLYELEKWLRDKLSGPHAVGDEVSAAVKGAEREVNGIRKAIDAAIDQASNGQWMQYKQAFGGVSRMVDDAVASRDLREAAGAQTRPLVGDVPHQTGRTLATDLKNAAQGEFGNRFGTVTQRELSDLTEFVRRIEEPMKTLKLAATGGGGSQTTMQAAQLAANLMQMVPGVGKYAAAPIMGMIGMMRKAEQEELARLMLNPAAAVEALRRSAATGAPLSKAEEIFRQIARTGARTEGQTGAGEDLLRRSLMGSAP